MSIPGGTPLWQIQAKDNVSQRLVPVIKQEHIPYRDDNMNLKMALA